MAKLPGWMVIEKWERVPGQADGYVGHALRGALRIRRWHPGFWWFLIKVWRGAL